MRSFVFLAFLPAAAAVTACSSSAPAGFGGDAGSSSSTSGLPGFSGTSGSSGGSMSVLTQPDSGSSATGSGTVVTTIYADTDDSLYSLDPMTHVVTLVGMFAGFGSGEAATDLAVDAEGDVYINSETAVYKAVLPTGAGTVTLTNRVPITLQKDQSFYALAFAPAGVLGSGETLVGGDNNGELWAIDPTSGATKDLGNFGPNPKKSDDILGLSGDIVFYLGATGAPTGLATIRSCDSKGEDCTSTNDYLAGIDMTALAGAYTSGTPAASLLSGIYGSTSSSPLGPGTGAGELFGLGAWQGDVFAFAHDPAQLFSVSTATGVASGVQSTTPDSGWAGAGVSTKTTITVMPPPAVLK